MLLGGLLFLQSHAYAQETTYRETFLDVVMNGEEAAESALFLIDGDGGVVAHRDDLLAWRLIVEGLPVLQWGGESYIRLDSFDGVDYRMDPSALTLTVTMPLKHFSTTRLGARAEYPPPQGGGGAYLNYDFIYQDGDAIDPAASGVMEFVAFATPSWGVLANSALLSELHDEAEVIRLESTWTRDIVSRRETLSLGDAFSAASPLSRPVRFGGFRWATDFSLDPGFISRPTGNIAGIAERPSTVEVFVDGARRYSSEVSAGPFEIGQITGVTGQGDIMVVVTDLLGREQVITQPYSFGAQNLGAGVSDFSFEGGALRENYGQASADYGPGFGAASYRYGLTDNITVGGHVEGTREFRTAGLESTFSIPWVGSLGLTALGSRDQADDGWRGGFSYDYSGRWFGFGVASEWTAETFRQIGEDETMPPPARVDRARFRLNLNPWGSFGTAYAGRGMRGGDDQSVLSATYSVKLGPVSAMLYGTRIFEPDRNSVVGLTLVIPLGAARSGTLGGSRDDNGAAGYAEYQKGLDNSDTGFAYRLRAEQDNDISALSGNVTGYSSIATARVDVDWRDGDASYRAGLGGSLVAAGGGLFMTRQVGAGFAVVDTGDVEGITVYRDNHEVGKTRGDGKLLVPNLQPWYANRVGIEPQDIPFDATAGSTETTAVPYARAGVRVPFEVKRSRSATLTLLDASSGEPVLSGSQVRGPGGMEALVARDGLVYLTGLEPGETSFTATGGGRTCQFSLNIPREADIMPNLGEVQCR